MNKNEVLAKVDHTLLNPAATWKDIQVICDDALKYGTASVCIPASFVLPAYREYFGMGLNICTVIGFPNGYSTTNAKCFEASDAVSCGANEIDMVANIGWIKEGRFDDVLREINAVKKACGSKVLKVIIETCLLTDDEKIAMCKVVSESNADFIKTSTGFSTGGATFEDIKLFKENTFNNTKIKAAGGIKSFADAEEFIALGADRLGTSRLVKIVKEEDM